MKDGLNLKVIHGNNIETLKSFPDNHFDSVVTDPPYGLGKEPDAIALLKDWAEKGYHEIKGGGFMGKEWDAFVPQPLFWKEVYRVLKPGGHVLAFYGTRTYDWGVLAMRVAGFEVRDCIQWLYGSGFPKGLNISKAIDKHHGAEREVVGKAVAGLTKGAMLQFVGEQEYDVTAPATDDAKKFDGWNTALKPANEPIVLCRKPMEPGLTIAENVIKWGTGGINVDGCRVSTDENLGRQQKETNDHFACSSYKDGFWDNTKGLGRYPANIILTHHPDCVQVGTKKIYIDPQNGGEPEEETIEDWNCHKDCPVNQIDEQSGISQSRPTKFNTDRGDGYMPNYGIYGMRKAYEAETNYDDAGGASRFFYVAKPTRSEREKGLDNFDVKQNQGEQFFENFTKPVIRANVHPTVKPVRLMQYLVKMVTPPGGLVLDPFCGSGTTGIASKLEGFDFVGLEQDAEYCKIAEARIERWLPEEDEIVYQRIIQEKSKPAPQLNIFGEIGPIKK
jgi:site-specific DNA-methyltransferase (adenine-specific)